ncbi:MAG: glutamate racemase [Clostridia bacterium]|nr:glutamate racemase [Clostridia bacterium]
MSSKNEYIAVFDSGVGGVSVLRELLALMPNERYLYFGDSANAPYGTRPTSEVRDLTMAAAEMLMARGCKALVVACNTATAAAIIDLRAKYPDKIIIGIEPALKVAADHFPGGEVGVMATPVTLREEKFDVLLHRFTDSCTVYKIPAPGLVQLVEAGKAVSPETEALLTPLLAPYKDKLCAVVLGCTHYPFAAPVIQRLLGENTALLDGGPGTARQTRRRLEAEGLLWDGEGELLIENSSGSEEMVARCHELLHVAL